MKVPLARPDHPESPTALLETLREILTSGRWSEGEFATAFEQRVAEISGSIYAVATNSGTSALEALCEAAGFDAHSEVICPSYTFIATVNPILARKTTPVFADIDLDSFNLNFDEVESKVNSKTKGIVLVHQFGIPANGQEFAELCRKKNLVLIEDAACGLGSFFQEKAVGTFGLAGLLSFHPRKLLSTGEGGMVLTDDEGLADRVRSIGNHGRPSGKKLPSERVGHNYRMSEFQAAIGLWALDRLDEAKARRKSLADRYRQELSPLDLQLVPEPADREWNYQSYPIRVSAKHRDIIMENLLANGIETSSGPLPAHTHPYIEHLLHPPRLPKTEQVHQEIILLPMYAALKSEEQEHVIVTLRRALSGK